jgi:pilus assembly protein CpaF
MAVSSPSRSELNALKVTIHRNLIQKINLDQMQTMDRETVRRDLTRAIESLVGGEATPMSLVERERLTQELLDEVFGLGPLEPLLKDPAVSDILVNSYRDVFVERRGILERTTTQFRDEAHLRLIIDRIVTAVGRRVDESSPMVDARLPDGSRVNAIISPLTLDGSCLSIRRFGHDRLTAEDLLRNQTFTPSMLQFLEGCVRARLNILISGGTGSGKTTMLNVLSSYISNRERIITIEDAAELHLRQDHIVRLETRPPNMEGQGAVRQRQLVINCLRMRPDRIILGEVRGEEALDMLQAMNTGHDGSLTTIHAARRPGAPRNHGGDVRFEPAGEGDSPAGGFRDQHHRADHAPQRRLAQGGLHLGNFGNGGRPRLHPGNFRLQEAGNRRDRRGARRIFGVGDSPALQRTSGDIRRSIASVHVPAGSEVLRQ